MMSADVIKVFIMITTETVNMSKSSTVSLEKDSEWWHEGGLMCLCV